MINRIRIRQTAPQFLFAQYGDKNINLWGC